MDKLKAELRRLKEDTEKGDKKGDKKGDVKIFRPALLSLISALLLAIEALEAEDNCDCEYALDRITKLICGDKPVGGGS